MILITLNDVIPIIIVIIVFSFVSVAHKVLLPDEYSSVFILKPSPEIENVVKSSVTRVLYCIISTILLYKVFNLTELQIYIGVFFSCLLKIWPSIIQNRLLRLFKNKEQWRQLFAYILFVGISVLICFFTIELYLPVFYGTKNIGWLDNTAVNWIITLIGIVFPFPFDMLVQQLSCVVVDENIDIFKEEVYILTRQVDNDLIETNRNKYLIDDVAKQNDINVDLLTTVLKLELYNRGQLYYRILEKIACTFFKGIAIKKDISVGIGQIKISTAEKVLRKNPELFVKDLADDKLNIEICGAYLKTLIDEYFENELRSNCNGENDQDIYDYIACQYLGVNYWEKNRAALVYSAILRNKLFDRKLYYVGNNESDRYIIQMFCCEKEADYSLYSSYEDLRNNMYGLVIKKEIFVNRKMFLVQLVVNSKYKLEQIRSFADEKKCQIIVE